MWNPLNVAGFPQLFPPACWDPFINTHTHTQTHTPTPAGTELTSPDAAASARVTGESLNSFKGLV